MSVASRWKYRRLLSGDPRPIIPSIESAPPFDIERLRSRGIRARVSARLFRALLLPILRLMQWITPVFRWGDLTIVTRAADVRAILADAEHFKVPFGPEMAALAGGATFVLGLDGPDHDRQRALIMGKLIRPDEDIATIRRLSRQYAEALLDAGKGRIDAQRDLMTRVAAEVCARYMGFAPDDADRFAEWSLAASNLLFADPAGSQVAAELGARAGANLRALVDRALHMAERAADDDERTLAARLVAMERQDGGPSRAESRAILIGLAVGFVPTNSLAGGRILQVLAGNRRARTGTLAALDAEDPALFRRAILECARLDPALAPGQWRWCPVETEFAAASGRMHTIPAQSLVLVSTMAALRDPAEYRQPGKFSADRKSEPDLLFGHLGHHCIGKELALAQIIPTLEALLRRPRAAQTLAGARMEWLGPFPDRMMVSYDDDRIDQASGGKDQNGLLFAVPMGTGETPDQINARIDGATGRFDWRSALDATGLVHFLSLTAIRIPESRGPGTLLMVEINCDGSPEQSGRAALAAIAEPLREILRLAPEVDVWTALSPHRIAMHSKPWGATALNFYGLPGLSVREIERQAALAKFAREAVDAYQQRELGRSSRAATVLRTVRHLVRHDSAFVDDVHWSELARKGAEFEGLLLKPRDRNLPLSDWDPSDWNRGWLHVARSRFAMFTGFVFVCLSLIASIALWLALGPNTGETGSLALSLPWLALQGLFSALVLVAILAAAFVGLLRWKESRDPIDTKRPSLAHLKALSAREDLPGHVKNHITVVTPLKTGLVRRLSLALALWGIGLLVTHFFRPGFVLSMGTIQFARWVRLPGTDTMIFQSNYDGSWESYLEDFITRAHLGQTAAWSNAKGFPRSRYMLLDGAEDGDSFKHYVRAKQQPTAFWYSRFPDISADQIRRNALIHDGLARATSDSEARAWLSLLGSAPRTDGEIESEEVQAIVFNGFARLPHAEYLLLRLPESRDSAIQWLQSLTGYRIDPATKAASAALASLLDPGGTLAPESRVTFGEDDPVRGAASIAFSAAGLGHLLGDDHVIAAQMPGPFAMGMHARSSHLGDDGEQHPDAWRWSDGGSEARTTAHALLAIYSPDPQAHERSMARHRALAEWFGLTVVAAQRADPLEVDGFPRDHFGFRDGIVQPVIAGAIKADRKRNPLDVIATGEMIHGYRNAQGYFPPPVTVPAEYDLDGLLPDTARSAERYPRFGRRRSRRADTDLRDFARNGTFMAVRVLEQHPQAFHESCRFAAERIKADYRHIEGTVSVPIDERWVAAKLVGRWQSGASLIGNPVDPNQSGSMHPGRNALTQRHHAATSAQANSPSDAASEGYMVRSRDYVLDFGRDDPRGLQCPLGSHVRRANPRDSLLPGDEQEIGIVNRHRLMRRGRNYGQGEKEKGLFFIAICEDLERQFEFVQRSWLAASGFHELNGETDPLIGQPAQERGTFSIPTYGGTITARGLSKFTTLRAGGYFFVPSRSALRFLSNPRGGTIA